MRIARLILLLLVPVVVMIPAPSRAQVAVGISVQFAPPDLPVYEQPPCPGDGYIWTPGYWGYDADDGYYWVPGTWVLAPVGLLWTPGYWAFQDGLYAWYPGYWGPQVGFYGGIDYGYGYVGTGYEGGYWNSGAFYYNRSVNNVRDVRNVYNKTVINNVTVNNVSFNGGQGGTSARPSSEQVAAARAQHTQPTPEQVRHAQEAATNRSQFASVNRGKPGVAATVKPAEFNSKGVVSAKAAAPYNPPPARKAARPAQPNRPANPRQPAARPENPGKNATPQPETRQPQNQPRQQPPERQSQPPQQQPKQRMQQPEQRPPQPPPQNHQQRMNPPEQHRPQEQPKAEPRPQERPPERAPEPRPEENKR